MTGILYDWAGSVIDKPLDPDGHYGNQCVDTIDHFGQFIFGVPWQECVGGVGGANQLLDVAPDKYWQRIDYYHGFIPQQFDVLVFGGDDLNQFGHTAVTWWATNTTINVIQQDGFAYPWQFVDGNYYSAKPAHYYTLNYSQRGTGALKGVLRPRPEMLIGGGSSINPSGTITPQEDELSADAVKQINDHTTLMLNQLALDGQLGGRTRGGMADVADKVGDIWAWLRGGEKGVRPAGVIPNMIAGLQGQVAGLAEAVKQLGDKPGQPIDLEAVTAAAAAGAEKALADLRIVSGE